MPHHKIKMIKRKNAFVAARQKAAQSGKPSSVPLENSVMENSADNGEPSQTPLDSPDVTFDSGNTPSADLFMLNRTQNSGPINETNCIMDKDLANTRNSAFQNECNECKGECTKECFIECLLKKDDTGADVSTLSKVSRPYIVSDTEIEEEDLANENCTSGAGSKIVEGNGPMPPLSPANKTRSQTPANKLMRSISRSILPFTKKVKQVTGDKKGSHHRESMNGNSETNVERETNKKLSKIELDKCRDILNKEENRDTEWHFHISKQGKTGKNIKSIFAFSESWTHMILEGLDLLRKEKIEEDEDTMGAISGETPQADVSLSEGEEVDVLTNEIKGREKVELDKSANVCSVDNTQTASEGGGREACGGDGGLTGGAGSEEEIKTPGFDLSGSAGTAGVAGGTRSDPPTALPRVPGSPGSHTAVSSGPATALPADPPAQPRAADSALSVEDCVPLTERKVVGSEVETLEVSDDDQVSIMEVENGGQEEEQAEVGWSMKRRKSSVRVSGSASDRVGNGKARHDGTGSEAHRRSQSTTPKLPNGSQCSDQISPSTDSDNPGNRPNRQKDTNKGPKDGEKWDKNKGPKKGDKFDEYIIHFSGGAFSASKIGRDKFLTVAFGEVTKKISEEEIGLTPIHGKGLVLCRVPVGEGTKLLNDNIENENGTWSFKSGQVEVHIRIKRSFMWVVKGVPGVAREETRESELINLGKIINKENSFHANRVQRIGGNRGPVMHIKFSSYSQHPIETIKILDKTYNVEKGIEHKECFRCWEQIGPTHPYTAKKCRKQPRCGHCAGDHWSGGCRIKNKKCILCEGNHSAFDCSERNYIKELRKQSDNGGDREVQNGRKHSIKIEEQEEKMVRYEREIGDLNGEMSDLKSEVADLKKLVEEMHGWMKGKAEGK